MPKVYQSDNSAISLATDPFEMDEFLPFVQFKDPKHYMAEGERIIITNKEVSLSEYLDKDKRTAKPLQLSTEKRKFKLPFRVSQGGAGSWDDKGFIEIKASGADKDIKFLSSTKILTSYDADIEVEIEIAGKADKEFYIDFFANDDEDDYNKGEYVNVHCGRFLFSILEKPARVGLRLTSNIEKLPEAPPTYVEPPTFSDPEASFGVANEYRNSKGMCFAVTMARVRKAYLDEFGADVISLETNSADYIYSGTVTNDIPDNIFGYGVGGALFIKGHAELVDHAGVWSGKLKEGALIQFWWGSDLLAIKNKIKKRDKNNPQAGHSIIFKSYIYGIGNVITGFKYYDYSGTDRTFSISDPIIFLGANLKDIR